MNSKGTYTLQQACNDLEQTTGAPCSILYINPPRNVQDPMSVPENGQTCRFCRKLNQGAAFLTDCDRLHRFSAYQAERFGGVYIYLCSISLMHWCVPVISEGMMHAVLLGGPVSATEIDTFFLREIEKKLTFLSPDGEEMEHIFAEVPQLTPAKVNSISEIYYAVASRLSDQGGREFLENREAFHQQSRIGDYIHLLKTMEGDKRSDIEYSLEQEKQLLAYTTAGDKTGATEVLNGILARVLIKEGTDLDMIRSRILELTVLLSRAALEGGADVEQIFGLNYKYLKVLRELDTFQDISAWVARVMERFIDLVFDLREVQHTSRILQALKFMQHHFYERITLQDLADQLELSPAYFGKQFKKETGVSVPNYLNSLRVKEAKRLLVSSSSTIGDIAYACGFEDQSYFTKVFSKVTGVSPGKYRETHL